jgi:hypothetical protein
VVVEEPWLGLTRQQRINYTILDVRSLETVDLRRKKKKRKITRTISGMVTN